MLPIQLEGAKLGEKHRQYNKLVTSATTDAAFVLENISYEDDDLDNLFKIDVACARRDTQYVMEVLKGGDMLYVSRALRRSTWLLSDDQYANIINPLYLHQQLFPEMTNKTKNKLLLAIRLNLKTPDRVEEFFKYYQDDIAVAQKFLPNCSLPFIENAVEKYTDKLSITLVKRLCKMSISILKKYCENTTYYDHLLRDTRFLGNSNPNECMDILDSLDLYLIPKFGVKFTKSLMKSCRKRIIDNYPRYYISIHTSTFAKYLGRENILAFLRILSQDSEDISSWTKFKHLSHFFRYLPHEERFKFAKKIFIEREAVLNDTDTHTDSPDRILLFFSEVPSSDYYYWYRFVPFEIAFTELKERICIESKPHLRNKILLVLLYCARHNPEHVQTLLTYYRDHHVNEAFKFKIQFINKLISRVHTHKFDKTTWTILDDIYKNMQVYIETENRVQFCVNSVVVYNVIHDQIVPDVIKNKFVFNTLKDYREKLDENERNKLFAFLFNDIEQKIGSQSVTKESEMIIMVDLIEKALALLQDWHKNLCDFKSIMNTIRDTIKLRTQNCWDVPLSPIYNQQKVFKKYLFEESILMNPSDAVCVNALKHDPLLLSRYKNVVDAMCCNDSVSLKQTLRKLRIYWSKSTAQEWSKIYLSHLKQRTGHKALLEGLCTILPQKQAMIYLKDYIPVNSKLLWTEEDFDEIAYKLSKNIAGNVYKIRPPVDINVVLQLAKGDYLQYAIPSLNEILYNISPIKSTQYATMLLDAPVSVQKLGIIFVTEKLQFDSCQQFITTLWANTESVIVKKLLFDELLKFLSKQENSENHTEIFKIVNNYINNMGSAEAVVILRNVLKRISKVPLNIRPLIFQKCYLKLSSLGYESLQSWNNILDIMYLMESSFIETVLLKSFNKYLDKTYYDYEKLNVCINVLSMYLLTCKSDDVQKNRYTNIFVPVAQSYLPLWRVKVKKDFVFRESFKELLHKLICNIKMIILENFVIPKVLFDDIRKFISTNVSLQENYDIVTVWNVALLFVEVLDRYVNDNPGMILCDSLKGETNSKQDKVWQSLCATIAPLLGESLANYYKVFIPSTLDSIYSSDADTLWNVLIYIDFSEQNRYLVMESMLNDVNVPPVCYHIVLIILKLFPCDSKFIGLRIGIIELIEKNNSPAVRAMRCFCNVGRLES